MKITIWVHKSEAISGKITNYFTHGLPQSSNWTDYVQVQISQDEFARLEDIDPKDDQEYSQDNWDSKVEALGKNPNSLMKKGKIYERNPDTGDIRSREINLGNRSEQWYKDQYNRNRNYKDQIK